MQKHISIILIILGITFSHAQTEQENYLNSLTGLSVISVTIGGQFPVTGTFNALISERADQFITRLFNETSEKVLRMAADPLQLKRLKTELNNYSLRDITLKRKSGETLKLDLLKFRLTGDFDENPYLKNDDIIIFPPNNIETNFFNVSGAVNNANVFYYTEGDRLQDAILLASGLNVAYEDIEKVEIHRLNYSGNEINVITVGVHDNVEIKRGDHIKVIADETYRRDYSVLVVGEVRRPGSIPVTKDGMTLSYIIEQAGGFTDKASLRRARVISGKNLFSLVKYEYGLDLQYKLETGDADLIADIVNIEQMMMSRMSNLLPEDTSYFFIENQLRVLTEGSSIDFTQINDPESEAANYIVKNDDVIIIPEEKHSVYVFGQVSEPGYIPFTEGKDFDYYIQKAGGKGEWAEEETIVIKGANRKWITADETTLLEPGDYVFVPKETLRSFRSYAQEYGIYIGIVGSIATILLLLVQISK